MAGAVAIVRSEELALLRAALSRDPRALARLVRAYTPVIGVCVRRVSRRLGFALHNDDLADLVHDVWESLLEADMKRLRCFREERGVRLATWISVLTRNRTVDGLRRLNRQRTLTAVARVVESANLDDYEAELQSPADQALDYQRRRIARLAVKQLRKRDQRFLEALYVERKAPEELAAEFGIAVGTVHTRRIKIQNRLTRFVRRIVAPTPYWRETMS